MRFSVCETRARSNPAYDHANPDCEVCRGSGVFKDTRDPAKHWDYWQIGGRWDGYLATLSDDPTDAISKNVIRVSRLPTKLYPQVFVSPETGWHESPVFDVDFVKSFQCDALAHWYDEVESLKKMYESGCIAVVDVHN